MAEEQFTSRRARREAERQAAEQAFEAREVPEQPQEAQNSRADLFTPRPPKKPESAPAQRDGADAPAVSPDADDTASRIDPAPTPKTSHERGALASDHPQESRPPVHAEDRLDPQRSPLPHFRTRGEKKAYLREHGLSFYGDLSTGAMPVIAEDQELAERQAASEGRLTGPLPEAGDTDTLAEEAAESAGPVTKAESSSTGSAANDADALTAEHESYDSAGFGGNSDEVAARDFEAPVTADSAPRPTTLDSEPYDALSMPFSALDETHDPAEDAATTGPAAEPADAQTAMQEEAAATPAETDSDGESEPAETDSDGESEPAETDSDGDAEPAETDSDGETEPTSRSRRMPIVRPPSTSGVRVVTAASAQAPTTGEAGPSAEGPSQPTEAASITDSGAETAAPGAESGSDAAARALAANPETRPMDAVPEAWALPNSDYEDEETENPPGARIRASSVTGHDGQILMGEEPSKMPYVVLGIAAFVALALIVVAFILF